MKKTICEIVNMIMIEKDDSVLVIDKVGEFSGYSFPGGHVEKDESFLKSVIREAKEETGYDIKNVKLKGIVNWCNKETGDRYIELLYETKDFSGTLIPDNREGKVFWMKKEDLKVSKKISENFEIYMNMYFDDKYSEVFLDWNNKDWNGNPIYM